MNQEISQFISNHRQQTFSYEPLPDNNPVNFILYESQAPYLELLIDAPYSEMLEEARALKDRFVTHRDDQSFGWRSLTIHGVESYMTNRPEEYGLKSEEVTYKWTDVAEQCPVTVNFFKHIFPYSFYQRLRYMLLEPGGYIMPHADNPKNGLCAAVNISLNYPDQCEMYTSKGLVLNRNTGSTILFNNHLSHCVYNDSNEDRYIIIVHGGWKDPEWSDLILKSYQHAYGNQTQQLYHT